MNCVTFVRGHSPTVKTRLLPLESVKPYVCTECPEHFCSASNLKAHELAHSD